jgi:hypothetical protein
MVDFLAVTVVDHQSKVVYDPEFLNDRSDSLVHQVEHGWWSIIEIPVLLLRNDQQMNAVLGAMVRDHNHLVGLEEDFGGDLAADYATENT